MRPSPSPLAFLVPVAGSLPFALGGCIIVAHDHDDCKLSGYEHEWDDNDPPRLGVEVEDVDRALAAQLAVDRHKSTLVTSVYAGRPADKAGLQRHDVIVQVDGNDDASQTRVRHVLRNKHRGEMLSLRVIRQGKPVDLTVTLD